MWPLTFQVINDILPVKARSEVDRLLAELQDGQFKLEFVPTTTIEYVDSLSFLDDIQVRVSNNFWSRGYLIVLKIECIAKSMLKLVTRLMHVNTPWIFYWRSTSLGWQ